MGESVSSRPLRLRVGLLAAVYMVLVWLSYRHLIAPSFAYLGYTAEPIDADLALYCAALGLLPIAWMPLSFDRSTKFVYWLVYLFVIIPAGVISPGVLETETGRWVGYYAVIILGFWIIQIGYVIDLELVPRFAFYLPKQIFWVGVAGLCVLNYGAVFMQFGLALRLGLLTNLLSAELTATRLEARQAFESSGIALSGYCLTWQSGVVNPFLIAYGSVHRQRVHLVAGLFGQLVLFSVAASKSMLISSLIVWLCIYLLNERRRHRAAPGLMAAVIGVVSLGGAHQLMTGSIDLNSVLARRAIMTPAVLTRYYFDFFATNPKTHLSQSVLGWLFDYPYVRSIPRTVGAEYVGDATSANANFFADAFANFGIAGVVAFSLLLSGLFLLIDVNSHETDVRLASAVLVVAGMSLVNSALLTSLLTHGVLLAMLMLISLDGRDDSTSLAVATLRSRRDPLPAGAA